MYSRGEGRGGGGGIVFVVLGYGVWDEGCADMNDILIDGYVELWA